MQNGSKFLQVVKITINLVILVSFALITVLILQLVSGVVAPILPPMGV